MNEFAEFVIALAKIFSVATLIMVFFWGYYTDTAKGYLGGYNWYTDSQVFNYHPLFMILGMVTVFTFSILSYRRSYFSHDVQKIIHACLNFIAIGFIGFGLAATWVYHNRLLYPNLYTVHSMVGFTAVLLFGINFVAGFVFFALGLSPEVRAAYHPFHVAVGMGAFIVVPMAVVSGIAEKNIYLGCGYSLTEPDNDPAETYHNLQDGCKLSNGIGVMTMLTVLLALLGLYTWKKPSKEDGYADSSSGATGEDRRLTA